MAQTDTGTIPSGRRQMRLAPEVLRWARERASIRVEDLAKKIPAKSERVEEWERTGLISRNQAERLASSTHTPFGYLFMKKPIREDLPIVDFRTRSDNPRQRRPSPSLLSTIYSMQRRRDWMRDYMIEYDVDPPGFVGMYRKGGASAGEIAGVMRKTLGLEPEWSAEHDTWKSAFSHLLGIMDGAGVMRTVTGIVGSNTHHKLDPDEFQGFALVDDYAPLVFVNGADYKAAQMFTAAHELAHIFTGAEGLSALDRTRPIHDGPKERLCNKIAAEFLVPTGALDKFLSKNNAKPDSVSAHFKVSIIVAARRMLDTEAMSQAGFDEFYADYTRRQREEQKTKGGDYWRNVNYRTSPTFGKAVVRAVMEDRLSYTAAYSLTDMHGSTFEKYAGEMLSR